MLRLRVLNVLAAAATALVLTVGGVSADTVNRTVKAGKSAAVAGLFYYNRMMCTTIANPQARIRRQPAHGRAVIKIFRDKLPKNSNVCPGMPVSGPFVVYTPNRGYRGSDSLSVDFHTYAYEATSRPIVRTFNVNITVK